MILNRFICSLLAILILLISCAEQEQIIPVKAKFDISIVDNNFTVPAEVNINNNTTGAQQYRWTFEGGMPATSDKKQPGTIVFNQAGKHAITLQAWNEDARDSLTLTTDLDSSVTIAFDAETLVNTFSPVRVKITNRTIGASLFSWTFEGGQPSISAAEQPGNILFTSPGNHLVTLKVSNGRKEFSSSKTIVVDPPLTNVDFEIIPSFDDEDYEAPLRALIASKAENTVTTNWQSSGGTIAEPNLKSTSIYFDRPGTYTISLEENNNKEVKKINKSITVKSNTNLRELKNVRLGISTAHKEIGSFYSTKLRRTIKDTEVNSTIGKDIDLVFFGLNETFKNNLLMSPDRADDYTFNQIPQALTTKFMLAGELLTAHDFELMTDDSRLRNISFIPSQWLTSIAIDKSSLILFQNAAGYKGVIKVKDFVPGGLTGSYILADIKVQKD